MLSRGPEPQWVPGTNLGGYEIVEHLASGGMAEVYIAMPARGGAPVVVKAMSRHLLHNEEFVRLFLDEAQLVATLDHPNIAQIYDRGQHAGVHYFVMEYVLGHSFREILNAASKVGGVPLSHALDMTCQVAAALHYAHDKRAPDGSLYGIVHRDLSHSNVLVTFDGVVKLIDFGVAKSSLRSTVTSVGSLKGKIRYMSPEQLRGEPIDRRTDVFALGVMFWEMSTGRPLFSGPNDAAIMHKILFEDIKKPSELVSSYPRGLDDIVMHALAKNSNERTGTAQQLGRELADFARAHNIPRGGLRVYSRQLFGAAIDNALARVEALRSRPLQRGSRTSVGLVARGGDEDVPTSVSRQAPVRVATSPTTLRVGTGPVAPIPKPARRPSVLAAEAGRDKLTRKPRSESAKLILLVAIVGLVVGVGLLLARYTGNDRPSPPSRSPAGSGR